ncbi:MAG: hypothetical protein ACOC8S_05945, partial [Bacteroidota bacterium]
TWVSQTGDKPNPQPAFHCSKSPRVGRVGGLVYTDFRLKPGDSLMYHQLTPVVNSMVLVCLIFYQSAQ